MPTVDRRLILHFDWTVFTLAFGLASIGVISVISASYEGGRLLDPLVIRQLIWIAAGLLVMVVAVLFDYRALETYAYPLYVLAVGLLALVMITGHATGGSRR